MRLRTNILIQAFGVAAQILNEVSPFLPDHQRVYVAIAVGVIQLAGAVAAHYSNPDGTSARSAWFPGKIGIGG